MAESKKDALAPKADDLEQAFFADAGEARSFLAKPTVKLATQVFILKDGQMVRGTFRGYGAPFEFEDPKTGEIRTVKGIILEAAGGKLSIRLVGNHELAAKMAEVQEGEEVVIVRGQKRDIGGGRTVAEYQVAHEPLASAPKALHSA
jgi:hypothetical protein